MGVCTEKIINFPRIWKNLSNFRYKYYITEFSKCQALFSARGSPPRSRSAPRADERRSCHYENGVEITELRRGWLFVYWLTSFGTPNPLRFFFLAQKAFGFKGRVVFFCSISLRKKISTLKPLKPKAFCALLKSRKGLGAPKRRGQPVNKTNNKDRHTLSLQTFLEALAR